MVLDVQCVEPVFDFPYINLRFQLPKSIIVVCLCGSAMVLVARKTSEYLDTADDRITEEGEVLLVQYVLEVNYQLFFLVFMEHYLYLLPLDERDDIVRGQYAEMVEL